ncbi:MAG: hypothetical protein ACOCZQ_00540 [Nanoarchaeota archaeon]
MDFNTIREELLHITQITSLNNAQTEFQYLLKDLEGNEEIRQVGEHLFQCLTGDLSSSNKKRNNGMVWGMYDSFKGLSEELKTTINIDPNLIPTEVSDNISSEMGQLVRFINFIRFMDKETEDVVYKDIQKNIKSIKLFIFHNRPEWKPKKEIWAESFKDMEKRTTKGKMGFEPFYVLGFADLLRTASNKKRHPRAFNKSFKSDFDFFFDYQQLISLYNLSLYSFIELLEAWASIKPYLDKHKGELS